MLIISRLLSLITVCLLTRACAGMQSPATIMPLSPTTIPTISMTPTSDAPPSTAVAESHIACIPTYDDTVSPSYIPNTPIRTAVGHGHILTGVIRSSSDCSPIINAKLEFWPEEAGKGHPNESRATLFSDQNGMYQFECNPPEHIHMRISAPGYRTIGVNRYHPNGASKGTLDIVLVPERRSI